MSKLISIFATSRNGVLGDNNKMLWRFKEDFKHFKDTTMGCPMIMGRKTFESLPGILPGREHIVLTRDINYGLKYGCHDNVTVFNSLEDILNYIDIRNEDKVFVIGGGEIYKLFEPYVNMMIITEINEDWDGDTKYIPNSSKFNINDIGYFKWEEQMSKKIIDVKIIYLMK